MHIFCFGELLCDMTGLGNRTFQMNAGGAPANCAVAAKKAGAESVFLCAKVGRDLFGEYLLGEVAKEGVSTQSVMVDEGAHTTLAFVRLEKGERQFSFYRLADAQITEQDVDALPLPAGGIFHFGSLSFTQEPIFSATKKAISLAKAAGNLISFDVNYRDSLWQSQTLAKERICEILPLCDIVKISEEEGEFLTGQSDYNAMAQAVRDMGAKAVVLSLGSMGSRLFWEEQSIAADAFTATAIDTTGAGDCFYGTLLAQIAARGGMSGLSGEEAAAMLRIANAAGALAVEGYGAIPSYPNKEQIYAKAGVSKK